MIKAPTLKLFGLVVPILVAIPALLAWRNRYRPVVRPGPRIAAGDYALPAPMSGLRQHVFNTSMNRMSWFVVGDARPWRPNPVFVIEQPRKA